VVDVEGRRGGGAGGSVDVGAGSLGRATGVGSFAGTDEDVDGGMVDDNVWV